MKRMVTVKRVGSGRDVGKLRVIVDITISEQEERHIAEKMGAADTTNDNLKQRPTRRGVGPVAKRIADAMGRRLLFELSLMGMALEKRQ